MQVFGSGTLSSDGLVYVNGWIVRVTLRGLQSRPSESKATGSGFRDVGFRWSIAFKGVERPQIKAMPQPGTRSVRVSVVAEAFLLLRPGTCC